MTTHLSLRMRPETLKKLETVSWHQGMTKSALAKALIEEGLRMDAYPGIVFKPGPTGRRAAIANGPDVWEIMAAFSDRKEPPLEEIEYLAESLILSTHAIQTAIRYYRAYPEEIEERIRLNDQAFEEGYASWLAQQPNSSR